MKKCYILPSLLVTTQIRFNPSLNPHLFQSSKPQIISFFFFLPAKTPYEVSKKSFYWFYFSIQTANSDIFKISFSVVGISLSFYFCAYNNLVVGQSAISLFQFTMFLHCPQFVVEFLKFLKSKKATLPRAFSTSVSYFCFIFRSSFFFFILFKISNYFFLESSTFLICLIFPMIVYISSILSPKLVSFLLIDKVVLFLIPQTGVMVAQ